MILFSHVVKRFGNRIAVNDISFKAKEGEIIGFLGPNGAGKTTTMRLLLGYLEPSAGVISINNLSSPTNRLEILENTGYLPENNPLYPEMKVGEYIEFISSIKKGIRNDVEDIIESVGLQNVIDSKIEELSRGYKQRVGLAAALIGSPKIIILDEPTSGLDPIEGEKIRNLIKRIAKKKTIIFSTHILSEVEDVATRLIVINKGSIVYDGVKPKGKGGVEKLFRKLVKSSE